jgi:hypothetical protein
VGLGCGGVVVAETMQGKDQMHMQPSVSMLNAYNPWVTLGLYLDGAGADASCEEDLEGVRWGPETRSSGNGGPYPARRGQGAETDRYSRAGDGQAR